MSKKESTILIFYVPLVTIVSCDSNDVDTDPLVNSESATVEDSATESCDTPDISHGHATV